MQNYDFSMGMRFHGNIIAMQNGLRALFVVSDSRTRELTEYFGLPVLEAKEFDEQKPCGNIGKKPTLQNSFRGCRRCGSVWRALQRKTICFFIPDCFPF